MGCAKVIFTPMSKYTFKKIESGDGLDEVFRLRFQVYCKECNFVNESDYPMGYETDEFDEHAVHFGAFDPQGQLVGAVRLILPSSKKFPLEGFCSDLAFGSSLPRREECAEISRLSISKAYRSKNTAGFYEESYVQEKPALFIRRVSPIVSGLCNAMYQECSESGINYCFALMEKALWLLLKLHGFVFRPLGGQVDVYGMVIPYIIDVREHGKKGVLKLPHHASLS